MEESLYTGLIYCFSNEVWPINSCEIGIKSTRLAKMDPMASGRWKPILKTDSHLVKDIGSLK